MELFEEVRVNLEQIQGRRIGHPGRLHETQEQEEIVQFRRLLSKIAFVAAQRGAAQDLRNTRPQKRQRQRATMTFRRSAVPPRLFSSDAWEATEVRENTMDTKGSKRHLAIPNPSSVFRASTRPNP
jgi:hypothetical protein